MDMLTFNGSQSDDPKIIEWIADHQDALGRLARDWFRVMRVAGNDVTELLHDGYLTVCIGEYPFAYVGAFKAHVNVGFFYGAELPDPSGLLQGTGKRMRHVKVKTSDNIDAQALEQLIADAYEDIQLRIGAPS